MGLRILFVTTSYPEPEGTQRGVFIRSLGRAIADKGNTVEVIAPGRRSHRVVDADGRVAVRFVAIGREGRESIATGSGGLLPSLLERPWRAAQVVALMQVLTHQTEYALEDFRPQIVHAHWLYPAGWCVQRACRTTRVPAVCTAHGSDVRLAEQLPPLRPVVRNVCQAVRACFAVSEHLAVRLRRIAPCSTAIPVVPLGVDTKTSPRPKRPPTSEENGPLRVVYVGRLVPKKSVQTLVRAVAMTSPERQLQCAIVGAGPRGLALKRLALSLGLSEAIAFLGELQHEAALAAIRQADVLVLPSLEEGRPTVILEAMAAGLPVLASDIPGIDELVVEGQTGFLFPPADSGALARLLCRLSDDPGLAARLGQEGRSRLISKRLTLEGSADRHLEVYQGILG